MARRHGCVSASVVDRLTLVVLAVELEDQTQGRPAQVDASDEGPVVPRDLYWRTGSPSPGKAW